ncbi:dihydrolipoyl dehydrogenase [Rhodococcus sp. RS1C4]
MSGIHFDVVVIGAGPGGYVAAIRASQLGLTTAVIEEKYWGGVCLNVGCIPTKALLHNAEVARLVTKEAATYGINGETSVDFRVAFDRSRKVAAGRSKGVRYLMKKNAIAEYSGRAVFLDDHSIQVHGTDDTVITFDHAIVATGATARRLPGTNSTERVVTYEEQILSPELPSSAIIVGAGPIGVEFAYILSSYGVEVTIVEYADRILPLEDRDVSYELQKRYKRLGIKVMTSTSVGAVTESNDRVTVSVSSDNEVRELQCDRLIQAIGFIPNTSGVGLEAIGITAHPGDAIDVDATLRTACDTVYAVGDVTGKLMLAHVAEAQGFAAAQHIAGMPTPTIDYTMMPRATFSQPQVASFGWTEEQARERAEQQGWNVASAHFPFMANGKAHGLGRTDGFVKVLSDSNSGYLLGAHMVGPDVTELLPELTLARSAGNTVSDLAANVHAHPTLGEALQEAFHGLNGHMINL